MNPRASLLILLAASLRMAAQTPSPALLVLNKEDATLSIIDAHSGKTVGTVPVGESPHELAASADGKLAFAANYGSKTPGSTISVIDLAARKELRRVDLGPLRKPHGIFVQGGKVYFTAETNKLIGRYDPASDKVDWLLGTGLTGTHMVTVSADGNTLYTANIGSDSIGITERAGPAGWNSTIVPVGKGPEGFDISPDGKQLWAAHSRDGGVSIIDLASKKVVRTLNVGTKRSNRLKFTPDGKLVLITDLEAGELVALDAASGKETKRLKMGRGPEGILMQPGGARAYIAVSGENKLSILDLKTLEVTGSVTTGAGPDGMAWVP